MSGAATAGMRGMNLLGCIFVGVLAATGGGTVRDLLLGQTPVFWLVEAIDTIGLASFAVAATQNGIRRKCHPGTTIVICCITCSGGGILRDVLTSSPVMALSSHAQMYVSTAAFGSGAYLLARRYSKDPLFRVCAGFFTVVILRLLRRLGNEAGCAKESTLVFGQQRMPSSLLAVVCCSSRMGCVNLCSSRCCVLVVRVKGGGGWVGRM
ncbi:conserved unknown protein [Ectocarpus siliculosus]|uniref:Glycine transporter domain-containing protein n=1 Tax=Ectocarpus siliculosus TaxID=2880 RepID=D8LLZ7_ECTSI|nr:conserved unknown protein [Ectocarpus siliculosus]|eukprot:CBN77211.1 conserved unknown protein [Ectocarpus siliculosus]